MNTYTYSIQYSSGGYLMFGPVRKYHTPTSPGLSSCCQNTNLWVKGATVSNPLAFLASSPSKGGSPVSVRNVKISELELVHSHVERTLQVPSAT